MYLQTKFSRKLDLKFEISPLNFTQIIHEINLFLKEIRERNSAVGVFIMNYMFLNEIESKNFKIHNEAAGRGRW